MVDSVVLDLWNQAIRDVASPKLGRNVALVAVGGYGRRALAPYSDVDLMMIPGSGYSNEVAPLAARFSRDVVDAGLALGFSVRTPSEACLWAWRDPMIFTASVESRFLAGSERLFSRFWQSFRRGALRRHSRLLNEVTEARRQERRRWGETNYLLSPNVKTSRGGLRDIQLIRWVGFSWVGERDLEQLRNRGALSRDDYEKLRKAYWFFTRLRTELHFRYNKPQNVLDRSTQIEIAKAWGYEGELGILPVESFMQEYFEHTRNVRYAAAHFVANARRTPLTNRAADFFFGRSMGDDIRMGPYHIWVDENALSEFSTQLPRILRLMVLANRHRKWISHVTWNAIRKAMLERKEQPPDQESIKLFLEFLEVPGRLGDLLRRMHELRILEKLIPAVKRTRGLLQFNEYHKYTVDEHSIRAVQAATELIDRRDMIGTLYRKIEQKWLLHLALLMHDLGKGFDRDHSEVGEEIAEETAEMLGLDEDAKQNLMWLIRKHLQMNHLALRHDLNDRDIMLKFVSDVGSLERLSMLTVLSIADLTAVGPGVLTDWKQKMLENLYERAERYFMHQTLPGEENAPMRKRRETLIQLLQEQEAPEICIRNAKQLPLGMLIRGSEQDVADELLKLAPLGDEENADRSIAWMAYDEERDVTRLAIVSPQHKRPLGTFARMTGAISSFGLSILRAEIELLGDELAWDTFFVDDPDHEEGTPPARCEEICKRVIEVVDGQLNAEPKFRKTWKRNEETEKTRLQPRRILFDNHTSKQFTILSIFAYDRPGLLYCVAKAMAECGLLLHFAKIGTHLDQVVDVFYVSTNDGHKVTESTERERIRSHLLDAMESMDDSPQSA